jgi:hypothetical protein
MINMEPKDNENPIQAHIGAENHNPSQPPNINTQIDEGLSTLISLVHELRGTREPGKVSLTTSLDAIVSSITSAQVKLTSIYEYMGRMFEYYRTGLDKNQVRDLNISKQGLISLFIDPRSRVQPLVNKKSICMD